MSKTKSTGFPDILHGFKSRSLCLVFWQRLAFKNQSEGKAYRRERDKERMEIVTVASTKDKNTSSSCEEILKNQKGKKRGYMKEKRERRLFVIKIEMKY